MNIVSISKIQVIDDYNQDPKLADAPSEQVESFRSIEERPPAPSQIDNLTIVDTQKIFSEIAEQLHTLEVKTETLYDKIEPLIHYRPQPRSVPVVIGERIEQRTASLLGSYPEAEGLFTYVDERLSDLKTVFNGDIEENRWKILSLGERLLEGLQRLTDDFKGNSWYEGVYNQLSMRVEGLQKFLLIESEELRWVLDEPLEIANRENIARKLFPALSSHPIDEVSLRRQIEDKCNDLDTLSKNEDKRVAFRASRRLLRALNQLKDALRPSLERGTERPLTADSLDLAKIERNMASSPESSHRHGLEALDLPPLQPLKKFLEIKIDKHIVEQTKEARKCEKEVERRAALLAENGTPFDLLRIPTNSYPKSLVLKKCADYYGKNLSYAVFRKYLPPDKERLTYKEFSELIICIATNATKEDFLWKKQQKEAADSSKVSIDDLSDKELLELRNHFWLAGDGKTDLLSFFKLRVTLDKFSLEESYNKLFPPKELLDHLRLSEISLYSDIEAAKIWKTIREVNMSQVQMMDQLTLFFNSPSNPYLLHTDKYISFLNVAAATIAYFQKFAKRPEDKREGMAPIFENIDQVIDIAEQIYPSDYVEAYKQQWVTLSGDLNRAIDQLEKEIDKFNNSRVTYTFQNLTRFISSGENYPVEEFFREYKLRGFDLLSNLKKAIETLPTEETLAAENSNISLSEREREAPPPYIPSEKRRRLAHHAKELEEVLEKGASLNPDAFKERVEGEQCKSRLRKMGEIIEGLRRQLEAIEQSDRHIDEITRRSEEKVSQIYQGLFLDPRIDEEEKRRTWELHKSLQPAECIARKLSYRASPLWRKPFVDESGKLLFPLQSDLRTALPFTIPAGDEMEPYEVVKVITRDGFCCQIATPICTKKYREKHKAIPIKVLFMGTLEDNPRSTKRDMRMDGAGYDLWNSEKGKLVVPELKEVMQSLREKYKGERLQEPTFDIAAIGHSLAGSDAQNFVSQLGECLNKNDVDASWIDHIDIQTFNTAGIPKNSAQRIKHYFDRGGKYASKLREIVYSVVKSDVVSVPQQKAGNGFVDQEKVRIILKSNKGFWSIRSNHCDYTHSATDVIAPVREVTDKETRKHYLEGATSISALFNHISDLIDDSPLVKGLSYLLLIAGASYTNLQFKLLADSLFLGTAAVGTAAGLAKGTSDIYTQETIKHSFRAITSTLGMGLCGPQLLEKDLKK